MSSQSVLNYFIESMKLESYGPDWYYFTYDIGMLGISIIRIRNSLDKYLPEFLHNYILPLLLLLIIYHIVYLWIKEWARFPFLMNKLYLSFLSLFGSASIGIQSNTITTL